MKTLNEITEEVCAKVLAEHRIERDEENATALLQVAWEMGNGIEYETAIQSIIEEAIKADRAQREVIPAVYDSSELQGAVDQFNDAWGADYMSVLGAGQRLRDIVNNYLDQVHIHVDRV